jgi:hypothetical protein
MAIIQYLTMVLTISLFVLSLIRIRNKIPGKKSAAYYEIIVINLILVLQLACIYRQLNKNETSENLKTTEIIHRKPGF